MLTEYVSGVSRKKKQFMQRINRSYTEECQLKYE